MRIKELRETSGFTQEGLAKKIGVDQTAISKWETGEALPRADKLPLLAKLLNCTIEDLFAKE